MGRVPFVRCLYDAIDQIVENETGEQVPKSEEERRKAGWDSLSSDECRAILAVMRAVDGECRIFIK